MLIPFFHFPKSLQSSSSHLVRTQNRRLWLRWLCGFFLVVKTHWHAGKLANNSSLFRCKFEMLLTEVSRAESSGLDPLDHSLSNSQRNEPNWTPKASHNHAERYTNLELVVRPVGSAAQSRMPLPTRYFGSSPPMMAVASVDLRLLSADFLWSILLLEENERKQKS